MSTPASIAKHPIHPMLVAFPIGLWVFSVIADLVTYFGGGPAWKDVAFYTLGGGIVGAVLAAVPGFIDFLTITDRAARRTAIVHLISNVTALVLFAVSFWLRWRGTVGFAPIGVSIVALVSVSVGGWFGGELVYVHNMGVTPPQETRARTSASQRRIA